MDYYTFGELPDDTSNINLKNENIEEKNILYGNTTAGADNIRNDFINKSKEI